MPANNIVVDLILIVPATGQRLTINSLHEEPVNTLRLNVSYLLRALPANLKLLHNGVEVRDHYHFLNVA
jgi:hypothetical protein